MTFTPEQREALSAKILNRYPHVASTDIDHLLVAPLGELSYAQVALLSRAAEAELGRRNTLARFEAGEDDGGW